MHWLDKIIAEQAAHYGLTVDEHASLLSGACATQEAIDVGLIPEPVSAEQPHNPESN